MRSGEIKLFAQGHITREVLELRFKPGQFDTRGYALTLYDMLPRYLTHEL